MLVLLLVAGRLTWCRLCPGSEQNRRQSFTCLILPEHYELRSVDSWIFSTGRHCQIPDFRRLCATLEALKLLLFPINSCLLFFPGEAPHELVHLLSLFALFMVSRCLIIVHFQVPMYQWVMLYVYNVPWVMAYAMRLGKLWSTGYSIDLWLCFSIVTQGTSKSLISSWCSYFCSVCGNVWEVIRGVILLWGDRLSRFHGPWTTSVVT